MDQQCFDAGERHLRFHFLRCSEAHLLVEMKERHFYIFWVWMVGEIVNGWFIRCHCSLQNWTTPKLRKTLLSLFCLLRFHFFFISVLVFFFFNSQFTAEKLQDINWLQCCLSKHQNQIYFLNICYLKKKRERKSKFTPISLLYLLFYTVYSNLLFYTVTPNVKKIHF